LGRLVPLRCFFSQLLPFFPPPSPSAHSVAHGWTMRCGRRCIHAYIHTGARRRKGSARVCLAGLVWFPFEDGATERAGWVVFSS
jgi:hypothetical protein